jgi:hypothetical protein
LFIRDRNRTACEQASLSKRATEHLV